MTSVNFQQWIQHPETLNRDTLYELRNLLARYPYFQSLRLLYLKNLYILHDISFGGELRKAVLYKGRIVKTAGPELAKEIEARGYDWIKAEVDEK